MFCCVLLVDWGLFEVLEMGYDKDEVFVDGFILGQNFACIDMIRPLIPFSSIDSYFPFYFLYSFMTISEYLSTDSLTKNTYILVSV